MGPTDRWRRGTNVKLSLGHLTQKGLQGSLWPERDLFPWQRFCCTALYCTATHSNSCQAGNFSNPVEQQYKYPSWPFNYIWPRALNGAHPTLEWLFREKDNHIHIYVNFKWVGPSQTNCYFVVLIGSLLHELLKTHIIQSHRYDYALFVYLRVTAIILFLLWEVDVLPVKNLLVFLRILCTRRVQKIKRLAYKTCRDHTTWFLFHTSSLLVTPTSHHPHQYQLAGIMYIGWLLTTKMPPGM